MISLGYLRVRGPFLAIVSWVIHSASSTESSVSNSKMQNGTVSNVQGQDPAGYGEPWPLLNSTFHQDQYNIGTALAHRLEQIGALDYFVVPG